MTAFRALARLSSCDNGPTEAVGRDLRAIEKWREAWIARAGREAVAAALDAERRDAMASAVPDPLHAQNLAWWAAAWGRAVQPPLT